MKYVNRLSAVLFCLSFFGFCSELLAQNKVRSLDRIVATVDQSIITESQLQEAMAKLKQQCQLAQGKPMAHCSPAALREAAIWQLIDWRLQLNLAKQTNVVVTDAQVDQTIRTIAQQHQLSVKGLQAALAKVKLSEAMYRSNIRDELSVMILQREQLGSQITVSPEAVNRTLNTLKKQNQAQVQYQYHIEDKMLLDSQQSWQNPASSTVDLGFRTLSTLPEVFVKPVSSMRVGQIKGPIRAPNGWHLIRLVAKEPLVGQAIKHWTRQEAEQMAYSQVLNQKLEGWLKALREKAEIQILP